VTDPELVFVNSDSRTAISVLDRGVSPLCWCISDLRSMFPHVDHASVQLVGASGTSDPYFRSWIGRHSNPLVRNRQVIDELTLVQRVSIEKHAVSVARRAFSTIASLRCEDEIATQGLSTWAVAGTSSSLRMFPQYSQFH